MTAKKTDEEKIPAKKKGGKKKTKVETNFRGNPVGAKKSDRFADR